MGLKLAKRRTIPGTNIPIGRKPKSSGLTQKQKEEINKEIRKELPPKPPEPERHPPSKNVPRLGSKQRPRLYGTGDRLDDVPFNVDQRPRNAKVRRIFDELGILSWRELFITEAETRRLSGSKRAIPFASPNDAIAYGKDGLLQVGLMRIFYEPRNGMYYVFVENSDPKRMR